MVALALLVIGLWVILAETLEHDRRTTEAAARTNAANLAHAFEEHVIRTVKDIDRMLLLLRTEWPEGEDYFQRKIGVLQASFANDMLVQIAVIGPDGLLASTNLQRPGERIDLSDREHFRIHRDSHEDRLFISKPVLGRVSGKWSIQFTRGIRDANGAFAGVLVISIDPDYFSSFYRGLDLGARGVVALVGTDRVIRARGATAPADSFGIGREVPPDRPYLQPGGPDADAYRSISPIDGEPRFHAYRRLKAYPLVVLVSLSEEEAFRAHTARRRTAILWAFGLTVAMLGAGSALLWSMRRQQAYRSALTDKAAALEKANAGLHRQQSRLARFNDALRLLNGIAGLTGATAADKLGKALRLGRLHFGMEFGILSRVTGEDFLIEHCSAPPEAALKPGHAFQLGDDCALMTLRAGNVVAVRDLLASGEHVQPEQVRDLRSYIGVPVLVRGEVFGTLAFSSRQHYEGEFDEADTEFVRLLGRWVGAVLAEEETKQELHRLATTDPLTGTWNRRHFIEHGEREFSRAKRYGRPLSLLMLDIDHFKKINDHYGHQAGDTALIALADCCRKALRDSDSFGRLGGEEFAVLLSETDCGAACEVAERLRLGLAQLAVPAGIDSVRFTVSIGVAEAGAASSFGDLLGRADAALYRAKDGGRNRVAADGAALEPVAD